MATYSTGVSVTWDGVAFAEVTALTWSYGGGPAKGRDTPWSDEVGTVTVESLGAANTSSANYGLRKQLVISGGGQSLTANAVWESLAVANELNGVTRYTVTLKLLDG